MKILFTCLSNGWGGLEMYSLSILLQLKKNNDVYLLAIKNSPIYNEANNFNIKTFLIKSENYFNPFSFISLRKLLSKEKFDVIHSHSSKDLWFLVPVLKFLKLSTQLHFTKHVASGIIKKDFLHTWLYSRINKVYAISKMIEENIIRTTSISKEKIILFYNGIDTQKYNPQLYDRKKFRNEINVTENEILIGMIGRISQGKGHKEFINSANILMQKYDNIKFVIVGHASIGEEEYYNEIKKIADTVKHKEKIIFTGLRKDIPEILSAIDIFVFPSHDESFGLTLVEAMSMQKANVATKASGVLEIAVDNFTSLLFNKEDVDDLTNKISLLIEDSQLRKLLGENSRKRVLENFDIQNYTKKLTEYYEETIK